MKYREVSLPSHNWKVCQDSVALQEHGRQGKGQWLIPRFMEEKVRHSQPPLNLIWCYVAISSMEATVAGRPPETWCFLEVGWLARNPFEEGWAHILYSNSITRVWNFNPIPCTKFCTEDPPFPTPKYTPTPLPQRYDLAVEPKHLRRAESESGCWR